MGLTKKFKTKSQATNFVRKTKNKFRLLIKLNKENNKSLMKSIKTLKVKKNKKNKFFFTKL